MTTYVYEILTGKPGAEPRYVEIKQSMKDSPLTRHPETGEPMTERQRLKWLGVT